MLGHLLPVLLTSLMHPNLQTLTLADALMPQLVQLVLYTSQVCICDCWMEEHGDTAKKMYFSSFGQYLIYIASQYLCICSQIA